MKILSTFLAAAAVMAFAAPAQAHPHVWVQVTSQVIYDTKGTATGVRHAWQLDDMYSAFALEGLQQKTKGVFTREELQDLAEVNITNLKESEFFTFAKAGGKDIAVGDATDYFLEYSKDVLTLNFTVPFKTPVTDKNFSIAVYDPGYFVAFGFAEKNAVALVGAPAQCKAGIEKPKETTAAQALQKMTEADFSTDNMGASYASKIAVSCP